MEIEKQYSDLDFDDADPGGWLYDEWVYLCVGEIFVSCDICICLLCCRGVSGIYDDEAASQGAYAGCHNRIYYSCSIRKRKGFMVCVVWCGNTDFDRTCLILTCFPVGGRMAVAAENITCFRYDCHSAYGKWLAAF